MPRPKFIVRRQPRPLRTWGVYSRSGRLVEGGFFDRQAALDCRDALAAEWASYCARQDDTPSLVDPMATER